jgi:signal peptidase I
MSEPTTETQAAGPDLPENRRKSTLISAIAWFRDLMLSVLIAMLIILFLYRPVRVEGTSMMPSLYDQERLFINQFSYKFGGEIHRGDTVVFWFPGDTTKSYIKRVIGIPGDVVAIDEGTVILNGRPLKETYVPPAYRDQISVPPQRIPQDKYFVLGDHRSSSSDSRMWGFVPRKYIYGKAVFVFWPPEHVGAVH